MHRDTKLIKTKRLQRAQKLETAFLGEFSKLGFWAYHIRSHNGHAPLLDVPDGTQARAPDLVIFNDLGYTLIEIKEAMIEGEHIAIYTHQLRDYMRALSSLPFLLLVCASSGDYSGYVGAITLHQIREIVNVQHAEERVLLPIMSLELVGKYRDTEVMLDSRMIKRAINRVDPHIDA